MFKNYSNCKRCVHNSVCQYKEILKETEEKINTKWDNIYTPEFFKLELECTEFKENSPEIKNNMWYA